MEDTHQVREAARGGLARSKKSPVDLLRRIRLRLGDLVRFLGAFLRGPVNVGAIAPSSRWLAAAMIKDCGLDVSDTVVELGPGTGSFTRSILEEITEGTTFFALELDPAFSKGLEKNYPNLIVYNTSAENISEYLARHGKTKADCIVSGLPWASLPMEIQERIMKSVLTSLTPGGVFTTFAYVHARWFPNALRFRRRLRRHFTEVKTSKVVWANLPPAFVYHCKR